MFKDQGRRLQLALAGALFMQGLDATIIVPAIPQIEQAFAAPGLTGHVLLGAYFIGCGASLPVIGWASDRFGAKRVLELAIALFILAGLVSAMAPDLRVLTASRFIQGAAAATLMPVARLLAVRIAPPALILPIITSLTVPAMAGQALGPALGGLLAAHDAWRCIFLAGIPFAAASLCVVAVMAPDSRREDCGPLDRAGVVLGVAAMGLAVIGISALRYDGPPPWVVAAVLASAVALGAAFVIRNLASRFPLVDFNILRDATFRRTFNGSGMFRLMVGSTPFLLAIHFQYVLNLGVLTSGLLIMASGAGALLVKPFSTRLIGRLGYRRALLWGGGLSLVTFLIPALSTAAWPLWFIGLMLLAGGFVRSLAVTAFSTLGYADLPRRDASSASVLSSIGQQLSHGLSVCLAAGVVAATLAAGIDETFAVLAGFGVIALAASLCLPIFARLPNDAGARLL